MKESGVRFRRAARIVQMASDDRAAQVRRIIAAIYLGVILALTLLFRSVPWSTLDRGFAAAPVTCVLRRWFGLKCAFCGMTHSWIALFKGEWGRAWSENAIGPVVFGATLVWAIASLVWPTPLEWSRRHTLGVLVVLAGYAIVRNAQTVF